METRPNLTQEYPDSSTPLDRHTYSLSLTGSRTIRYADFDPSAAKVCRETSPLIVIFFERFRFLFLFKEHPKETETLWSPGFYSKCLL